ncbi:MAG: hypothetical protein A2Z88_09505 [Omnitrophica WOR_2 bacterium GWA2_47_8]|nr:MAG: hypothetical protein A2Z88_09505 [Omnitrophica WOR_2 bacterium GWA2_47_8]
MTQKIRKKILVIDDHPMMHRELEKILSAQGFEFLGCFDAISGIRKVKESLPDLVLLDMMLPELDGKQVVRSIKTDEETKHIPVIFITATLSKRDDKKEKTIDVDGVTYPAFAKPLFYLKLISTIRHLIDENEKSKGISA